MSTLMLARPRAPRAAFGNIVRNEARLAWRQPSGLIVSVGISLLLLIIFGEVPAFQASSARLGGLSAFDVYLPVLISFVIVVLAPFGAFVAVAMCCRRVAISDWFPEPSAR